MTGESEESDKKKLKWQEKKLGPILPALNMEEDHKSRNVMASKS